MSSKSRWDNGGWNVICDVCGRKFKDNDLQLRWDGLMVCSGDWETRQPQDFVHGVADIQAPPFTRPEQTDYFVPINYTQQPVESIDVVENLVKAVVKNLTGESISFSESTVFSVGYSVSESESIGVTESVSNFLTSPTVLNGNALNSLGLN